MCKGLTMRTVLVLFLVAINFNANAYMSSYSYKYKDGMGIILETKKEDYSSTLPCIKNNAFTPALTLSDAIHIVNGLMREDEYSSEWKLDSVRVDFLHKENSLCIYVIGYKRRFENETYYYPLAINMSGKIIRPRFKQRLTKSQQREENKKQYRKQQKLKLNEKH